MTLCAIRDAFTDAGVEPPADLAGQIAASATDWRGETQCRMRLDLQYEDAGGVLAAYGNGNANTAQREGTRSIRNLASAYDTVREFLRERFLDDPVRLRAFYGFLVNKVKLIRIDTPNVSRALKIFETVNDRGVGLDAMDLLKNLLFMHARDEQYDGLKTEWRELTRQLYAAGEKPLRFLRYVILADYDVKEGKLREEEIYDWLVNAKTQTGHVADPLTFARRLKHAAEAYAGFTENKSPAGVEQSGLFGTRAVGGSTIRQHYVLLLAGRHLEPKLFTRLSDQIEQLMALWLFSGVSAKDYERAIVSAARQLRSVENADEFDAFAAGFFDAQKREYAADFQGNLRALKTRNVRQFRIKYLLAKIALYFDGEAYGDAGHESLAPYIASNNEVEHILAQSASPEAKEQFGDGAADADVVQSLGNLMLLEKSVNIVAGAAPYSSKCAVYSSSKFLLSRCQHASLQVGVNDKITRAMKRLDSAPTWNRVAVEKRQRWFADIALDVWDVRRTLA